MKTKRPTVQGGNTEATTTAKALRRFTIETMRQTKCTERDAHIQTCCFTIGANLANGVSLPQQVFIVLQFWFALKVDWFKGLFNRSSYGD